MTLSSTGGNKLPGDDALGGLYQEIIREHTRFPRFKGKCAQCRFCQEGKNASCGDEVCVFLKVDETQGCPKISASFDGHGCSISQASASMMCQAIQGLTIAEARSILGKAEKIYSGEIVPQDPEEPEDDLEALAGVSKFPVRVKCAALPWKSLEMLLDEHFNSHGALHQEKAQEESKKARRLKIVTTEQ